MSDEKLRLLEASWRASGSVEDEAAFLLERVRVGELKQERLQLAAFCGDPAARLTVKEALISELTDLSTYPEQVIDRACIAVARRLIPIWEGAFPEDRRISLAVERAEGWLQATGQNPDDFRVPNLGGAEHDAARLLEGGYQSPAAHAAVAVDYTLAGVVCGGTGIKVVGGCAEDAFVEDLRSGGVVAAEARLQARSTIVQAVTVDLIPWALGYGDPVRERVAARQKEAACG